MLLVVVLFSVAFLTPFGASSANAAGARQNSYPIVLVHGFAGWGRDELLGFKYWGGLHGDLQQDLTDHGYLTFTAAVGPVSSNWDRACELYAQIKGGTVDYGLAHSQKYGHARYGRTFPGLYPQWGQLDTNGLINKVHLIGHSMGGQTIRVLVQLLEGGSPDEIAATPANQLSPLFKGGKSWVDSVTTIATPNDGTTLATGVQLIPYLKQVLILAAAAIGSTGENFYDFKLDQWGLTRQPGESFDSYANRVYNSNVWNNKDFSAWDLTPDGAAQLNSWVKAWPDVYYFSVATGDTFYDWFTGHQDPDLNMNIALSPFAWFMGAYTRNQAGMVRIDSSWWENDGVVNTISTVGPHLNTSDQIVNYNATAGAQRGKWNALGLEDGWDHLAIVGLGLSDVSGLYEGWATMFGTLGR
jgi:triacylglycerol lipase